MRGRRAARGRRIAAFVAVAFVLQWPTGAQQPAPVAVVRPNSPSIEVGDLRATKQATRGRLRVTNHGPHPVRPKIGLGTAFRGSGGGKQMVMSTGRALPSSSDPSNPGGPSDGGDRPGPLSPPSARTAAAASAGAGPVVHFTESAALRPLAPGESMWVDVEILCIEATRSNPEIGDVWIFETETDSETLDAVRSVLARLDTATQNVDADVAELARHVTLIRSNDGFSVSYEGPPLTHLQNHLLKTTDWGFAPDGSASGTLNRSLVEQFALWVFTDQYTERDLDERLDEERFRFAQPHRSSYVWMIRHVLRRAGYDPDRFDPPVG